MTKDVEDALYADYIANLDSGMSKATAFGIAIRAAYAKGREDAAKVCDELADTISPVRARQCAAAIREGK